MKILAALVAVGFSTLAHAECEPIPSSWTLHPAVDRSVLKVHEKLVPGDYYDDAVSAIYSELRPGEPLVPFGENVSVNGHAGGGAGFAIIRGACLIKRVYTLSF